MKPLTFAALGLMTLTVILMSYTFIQTTNADVCLSCIGDKLKQKAQDIQNNQKIPEPSRNEIAANLAQIKERIESLVICQLCVP